MANRVNQNVDPADRPDPTQGRRRECARRLRQMDRKNQKELVKALHLLTEEQLAGMGGLDDAQCGFVEHAVQERLLAAGDATPEGYARAIVAAAQDLVDDNS